MEKLNKEIWDQIPGKEIELKAKFQEDDGWGISIIVCTPDYEHILFNCRFLEYFAPEIVEWFRKMAKHS